MCHAQSFGEPPRSAESGRRPGALEQHRRRDREGAQAGVDRPPEHEGHEQNDEADPSGRLRFRHHRNENRGANSRHDQHRKDHEVSQQHRQNHGEQPARSLPKCAREIDRSLEIALRSRDDQHRVRDRDAERAQRDRAERSSAIRHQRRWIAQLVAQDDAQKHTRRHRDRAHGEQLRIEAAQQLEARIDELGGASRTDLECGQAILVGRGKRRRPRVPPETRPHWVGRGADARHSPRHITPATPARRPCRFSRFPSAPSTPDIHPSWPARSSRTHRSRSPAPWRARRASSS